MKKNLYSLLTISAILALASCGRVTAPSQTTSLGDQQEPSYQQQTEALMPSATAESDQERDLATQQSLADQTNTDEQQARENDYTGANRNDRGGKQSVIKAPKLEKPGRAERISRKDPFGERYAQANQNSVGVHNQQNRGERSLLSASSIMMAAPAAAYAQARQRYDFSDPLYMALFIILLILLVALAITVISGAISSGGWVGVAVIALLIILLIVLL